MIKKILGIVKWVFDTGLTLLPYVSDFKNKKALISVMLAVQKFGKTELPADKWKLLKGTIKDVSKELGGDIVIAKVKAKLEKNALKWEFKFAKKLFGN